jgi:transcriptional regulator with XRE-family HTH domain
MACVITPPVNTMAITAVEREFFVSLGSRIAQLRKEAHLTQVQLAHTLDVAQPTLNAYELGQRRVPVSALPALAKALGVTLETLMGEADASARKRGPAPKLQQHMDRISQLPKPQQRFVLQVLESVLAQASR